MTIITAISDGSSVWIGNNSAYTVGDIPLSGGFDPWVRFGDWALGVTGDSFQQDFLTLKSKTLSKPDMSPYALMENIRTMFIDSYISIARDNHASASFGIWCILVNKDGRVWDVDNHLALSQIPINKVWARGSGMDYALGADFAISEIGNDLSPLERVRACTQAAIINDISCPGDTVVAKFI